MTSSSQPAFWSRPKHDHKTDAVPGTFSVDRDGRLEVRVFELWDQKDYFALAGPPDLPEVLHGEVMGRAVTVVECSLRSIRSPGIGRVDMKVIPRYAIEGLFINDDELHLTDVRFRLSDQDLWTQWDTFSAELSRERSGALLDVDMQLTPHPSQSAQLDSATLSLVDRSDAQTETNGRLVFSTRSEFQLSFPEAMAIDEIIRRYIYPLKFAMLLAHGRQSRIEQLTGRNTTWNNDDGSENEEFHRWLRLQFFDGEEAHGDAQPMKRLFSLSSINFQEHMPTLMSAVESNRYAVEHYTWLASGDLNGFLARFGSAAQCIDSFDRTLHPHDDQDQNYNFRLKRLDTEVGLIIESLVTDKKWKDHIRKLRNAVLHGYADAASLLRDPTPLISATQMLMLLFEARFLVEVGLASGDVKRLLVERGSNTRIEHNILDNYTALKEFVARLP